MSRELSVDDSIFVINILACRGKAIVPNLSVETDEPVNLNLVETEMRIEDLHYDFYLSICLIL